jgi:hypothetical protein
MKTQFFKILGFNFDNVNEFWSNSIKIGIRIKDINNNNNNNPALLEKNLVRTREDELNTKIFHILNVLRNYKINSKIELPNNFWIGMRLYTRPFKNSRKLEYLSGDFDFLIGGLDNNLNPINDNIIGIETKIFRFRPIEKETFNESYRDINENFEFRLERQPKNDGIMPGLRQITSYGYFCNKVILLYCVTALPAPNSHNIMAVAFNDDIISNAMKITKEKYKEKLCYVPDYIGFSISGLVQVPDKDPLYSGTPVTPIRISDPDNHSVLLNDRKDFIDTIKKRIETAI